MTLTLIDAADLVQGTVEVPAWGRPRRVVVAGLTYDQAHATPDGWVYRSRETAPPLRRVGCVFETSEGVSLGQGLHVPVETLVWHGRPYRRAHPRGGGWVYRQA